MRTLCLTNNLLNLTWHNLQGTLVTLCGAGNNYEKLKVLWEHDKRSIMYDVILWRHVTLKIMQHSKYSIVTSLEFNLVLLQPIWQTTVCTFIHLAVSMSMWHNLSSCRCVDNFGNYRHGIDNRHGLSVSMCRYSIVSCRCMSTPVSIQIRVDVPMCRYCMLFFLRTSTPVSIPMRVDVSMCRYRHVWLDSSVDTNACRCVDVDTGDWRPVSIQMRVDVSMCRCHRHGKDVYLGTSN